MNKDQLRKDLIDQRFSLDEEVVLFAGTRVVRYLLDYIEPSNFTAIGSYSPIHKEINIEPIELKLPKANFYLPKVMDLKSRILVWGERPLKLGFKGILEPVEIKEDVTLDMVLVPCIGFNDQGYRLGYGGGFYDSYLNRLESRPHIVGIAYNFSRSTFMAESHDHRLDAVVTELGISIF
jgi:5,10-methenyltetrahydrofolate synthetase